MTQPSGPFLQSVPRFLTEAAFQTNPDAINSCIFPREPARKFFERAFRTAPQSLRKLPHYDSTRLSKNPDSGVSSPGGVAVSEKFSLELPRIDPHRFLENLPGKPRGKLRREFQICISLEKFRWNYSFQEINLENAPLVGNLPPNFGVTPVWVIPEIGR